MSLDKKEILITKGCVLRDIQNAFTGFFPYLKIVFLQTQKVLRSRSITIDLDTSIMNLNHVDVPIKISIDDTRTIAQVSDDFEKALGFSIEVLRKSGNVWNVISVTKGWTLESQNSAGRFISMEMASPLSPD